MRTVLQDFDTEAEALAFVQGIEYANDSALTVAGPPAVGANGRWVVVLLDEDGDEGPTQAQIEAAQVTEQSPFSIFDKDLLGRGGVS